MRLRFPAFLGFCLTKRDHAQKETNLKHGNTQEEETYDWNSNFCYCIVCDTLRGGRSTLKPKARQPPAAWVMANARVSYTSIQYNTRSPTETSCEISKLVLAAIDLFNDRMKYRYDVGYHDGLGVIYVMRGGRGAYRARLSEEEFWKNDRVDIYPTSSTYSIT
jgi:hypothetical protein